MVVVVCGCLWLLVAVCGCLWLLGAACGCLWLLVAACGCLWLLVDACGCLWLLVAACGCLRLLVADCGCWWRSEAKRGEGRADLPGPPLQGRLFSNLAKLISPLDLPTNVGVPGGPQLHINYWGGVFYHLSGLVMVVFSIHCCCVVVGWGRCVCLCVSASLSLEMDWVGAHTS